MEAELLRKDYAPVEVIGMQGRAWLTNLLIAIKRAKSLMR